MNAEQCQMAIDLSADPINLCPLEYAAVTVRSLTVCLLLLSQLSDAHFTVPVSIED